MDDEVCPVLQIARIYSRLARELELMWKVVDCEDADIIPLEQQYELQEAVSHLTARSVEGASFQIWLAHHENDRTSDADAPAVQQASRQQVGRLLYRAGSVLSPDDDWLADLREHLMPKSFDPARERLGHVTAELVETEEAA
jgi:hypothetical protein